MLCFFFNLLVLVLGACKYEDTEVSNNGIGDARGENFHE